MASRLLIHRIFCILVLLMIGASISFAQTGTISGTIQGAGQPLSGANIVIQGIKKGTSSNNQGRYQLTLKADTSYVITVSHIGYADKSSTVNVILNQDVKLNFDLNYYVNVIQNLVVVDESNRTTQAEKLDPKLAKLVIGPNDSFESILPRIALGTTSNNELSSQYSVRGGNFDENLVYVNDVQIYRPFLIRSGQQEGLSFINGDLVESVEFSAGGFEARYGDKMSSVLDVKYKSPTQFTGGATMSLLGGSAYLGDVSNNYRFRQIHGVRYKTNKYILGSLDTDGAYQPTFFDYQTFMTYDVSDRVELGFIGYVSRNQYKFIPEVRQTDFGTIAQALRLTIFFDGQEIDDFTTYMGALTATYRMNRRTELKWTASAFRTVESETFDILGQYWLDELERDLGDEDFGDVKFNRGVGSFLDHARNSLDATVVTGRHIGKHSLGGDKFYQSLHWGATVQGESITDKIREWNLIDSAGYSLPQQPKNEIVLDNFVQSSHQLQSTRLSGYGQHDMEWANDSTGAKWTLKTGVRSQYWTVNDQITVSPRSSLSYAPNFDSTDIVFRGAIGVYHQPPFYRELRDLDGEVFTSVRAQTSIHYVVGSDYNFKIWGRPFKFVSELYYKQLRNLIPYEYDNVRIRYYANNNAVGDAKGIDLKINGEFVPGVESWANLSVMQVREDIRDDFYYQYTNQTDEGPVVSVFRGENVIDSTRKEPGYIPRPTDQRINFGLFFQDYLPRWPSYKMNLNLLFGTGLPFGPPSYDRFKDTLRIPAYRRVDVGFSKQLISERKQLPAKNPFHHFKSMWVSLEVFNLLQVSNTISYLWIKDVTNTQYAVPNFLTNRRINLRLVMDF